MIQLNYNSNNQYNHNRWIILRKTQKDKYCHKLEDIRWDKIYKKKFYQRGIMFRNIEILKIYREK
jgi:hypothetical protein